MTSALVGTIVAWDTAGVRGAHHKTMTRKEFNAFRIKVPCISIRLYEYAWSLTPYKREQDMFRNVYSGVVYISIEDAIKFFGNNYNARKVRDILRKEAAEYHAHMMGAIYTRFQFGHKVPSTHLTVNG